MLEQKVVGDIELLVMDRTKVANALDMNMATSLASALSAAESQAATKAVVLMGAGQRSFSAGIDLGNPDNVDDEALRKRRSSTLWIALESILSFRKPLVVALNGVAAGGGAIIALCADRVVASANARIVFPEIDRGMSTLIGLELLAGLCGEAVASDLVLTGRQMHSTEAATHCLVHRIAAETGELAMAIEEAEALGSKPLRAFQRNKVFINERRLARLKAAVLSRDIAASVANIQ